MYNIFTIIGLYFFTKKHTSVFMVMYKYNYRMSRFFIFISICVLHQHYIIEFVTGMRQLH